MNEDLSEERDCACAMLATALSAYATGLSLGALRRRNSRCRVASHVRQVAMYICHVGFGMSLTRIARAFQRDRSTVSSALHAMEDRRDEPDFDALCDALEAVAAITPPPPAALRLPELAS